MPISLKTFPKLSYNLLLENNNIKFSQWGVQWLNLVGMVVLINSFIPSLLIFQFTTLLAPNGVRDSILKDIKFFLWQGGMDNTKRLRFLKWVVVRTSKLHEVLGIKDISLMNLALAGELVWRLVTGQNYW